MGDQSCAFCMTEMRIICVEINTQMHISCVLDERAIRGARCSAAQSARLPPPRKGSEMTDKVRLNLQLSQELTQALDTIAGETGTNRTDVLRQALALMKVAHEGRRKGRHLGLVEDADKLDTEIVGLI